MTKEDVKQLSEHNFKLLIDIYNIDDKNCLPFLGAGISTPTGIDNWTDLLINLAADLGNTITDKDNVNELINKYGHAKTASIIKEDINDSEKYKKFLVKQFEPTNILTTSTIIKVIIKFFSIVTTNYDTTIEEAIKTINYIYKEKDIEKLGYELQDLPQLASSKLLKEKSIVYLHGYKKNETFLLTEEDYKLFYPSNYSIDGIEVLENFLKEIISNMTLIFMGFSFNDKDFCDFFKRTKDKIENQRALINEKCGNHNGYEFNHFAFVKYSDDGFDEFHNKLEDLGIKVIYYFDKYSNLEEYLHRLEKVKAVKDEEYPSE